MHTINRYSFEKEAPARAFADNKHKNLYPDEEVYTSVWQQGDMWFVRVERYRG